MIGNNFDDLQGKLLDLGSTAKVGGGIFKFLGENLGAVQAVTQGVTLGFQLFDQITGKTPERFAPMAKLLISSVKTSRI